LLGDGTVVGVNAAVPLEVASHRVTSIRSGLGPANPPLLFFHDDTL